MTATSKGDPRRSGAGDPAPGAGVGVEEPPSTRRPSPPPAQTAITTERLALWIFLAYLGAALIVLSKAGTSRWFAADEWDFLTNRSATHLDDLFRSHNQHWSTVPILAWRSLYAVFGVRSYFPYQLVTIVLWLTTCGLVRVVMRRAAVGPWIATLMASTLVLFGPGSDDVLWAFQMGFTGAVVLGLTQLILSDHRGPIDRRDWLGLVAGALALMSSGQGPPIILATGLAVLVKRGWKPAAFHAVPLGLAYVIWFKAVDASLPDVLARAGNSSPVPPTTLDGFWAWMRASAESLVDGLGHFTVLAIAIAGVVEGGWTLAVLTLDRATFRLEAALPGALMIGTIAGVVAAAQQRAFFGPEAAKASRYLGVTAALMLPAFAYAVKVIVDRWRWSAPAVLALFLIPVPWNARTMVQPTGFGPAAYQEIEALVANIPRSPLIDQVPRWVVPNPAPTAMINVTTGWLLDAKRAGKLPRNVPVSAADASRIEVMLGVTSVQNPEQADRSCPFQRSPITLTPRVHDLLVYRGRVDVSLSHGGQAAGSSVEYDSKSAKVALEVLRPDLELRIEAPPGQKYLVLCT